MPWTLIGTFIVGLATGLIAAGIGYLLLRKKQVLP